MNDSTPTSTSRIASVRRTVVALVVIVLVIYGGFILSGFFAAQGTVSP